MKDTDIATKNGTEQHDNYINDRLSETKTLLRKAFEATIKTMIAFNAVGIATLVSLLSTNILDLNLWFIYSISLFLLGFIICIYLMIRLLFRLYLIDKAWDKNSDSWYKGELTWGELNNIDKKLTKNDTVEFILIIIGFLFPILGCILAVINLYNKVS